jgi:hypothetical protein
MPVASPPFLKYRECSLDVQFSRIQLSQALEPALTIRFVAFVNEEPKPIPIRCRS